MIIAIRPNRAIGRWTMLLMVLLGALASPAQTSEPSQRGYAPVNGIQVYYEVYGQGKPLILLHGAFYTISLNWGSLIPALAQTRKVIALEMQGHGHSPYSNRKLDIRTLARDVEALMDYLKIDSADVAGYSMGGSVAYQFAVQSPKRLRKLVIISASYKTDGFLPIVNRAFDHFKPEFFDNSPLQSAYDAVAPDTTHWRKFLEQMIAFAHTPFDVGDSHIAKITAPVLIIAGDNDGTDKIALMKTYQLLGGAVSADLQPMPSSQLAIIPSQSHVSLMNETDLLARYINNFLQ